MEVEEKLQNFFIPKADVRLLVAFQELLWISEES